MKNVSIQYKKCFLVINLLFTSFLYSQTQQEMNATAYNDFKKADSELNSVYANVRTKYSNNKEFLKNLKSSQLIWIKFRDAEMLVKYPENGSYGSVYPMCYSMYKEKLTLERTQTLRYWLAKYEEGDVCSGSVK